MNRSDFAPLGFGVGLRRPHYIYILDEQPLMDWFEVISENFMVEGGRPLEVLEGVRSQYPIVMHGVWLSACPTRPPYHWFLREHPKTLPVRRARPTPHHLPHHPLPPAPPPPD